MSGRAGAGEAARCVCAQVRAAPVLPDHHLRHHQSLYHRHHDFDMDDGQVDYYDDLDVDDSHYDQSYCPNIP